MHVYIQKREKKPIKLTNNFSIRPSHPFFLSLSLFPSCVLLIHFVNASLNCTNWTSSLNFKWSFLLSLSMHACMHRHSKELRIYIAWEMDYLFTIYMVTSYTTKPGQTEYIIVQSIYSLYIRIYKKVKLYFCERVTERFTVQINPVMDWCGNENFFMHWIREDWAYTWRWWMIEE